MQVSLSRDENILKLWESIPKVYHIYQDNNYQLSLGQFYNLVSFLYLYDNQIELAQQAYLISYFLTMLPLLMLFNHDFDNL